MDLNANHLLILCFIEDTTVLSTSLLLTKDLSQPKMYIQSTYDY